MKDENAIEVHNIYKSFKVYKDKGRTLKEKILFQNRRQYEIRTVLDGISFDVKKGEAIGLIGQNGCGKSTTLKLLTRIMYPDSGDIVMRGRVSSLIELGAGFHPDMSGRQNIYINASIFGLTRKEIDARLNDIIDFSELEEYIDNPVRTYSSGMYMRLAFSVAINVDADILLIDEILAVGDANFQAKCFNKLREIKANGTTIVIVSHSLNQIEQICERSIWIHKGQIKAAGVPRDIHLMYLDFMGKKGAKPPKHEEEKKAVAQVSKTTNATTSKKDSRWGNGKARITSIKSYNESNEETSTFKTGEKIRFVIDYDVYEKVDDAVIGIGIFRNDGVQCYGTNTRIDKMQTFSLAESGQVVLEIYSCTLLAGEYTLDFAIESGYGTPVDYFTKAYAIHLFSEYQDVGVARLTHNWRIDKHEKNN